MIFVIKIFINNLGNWPEDCVKTESPRLNKRRDSRDEMWLIYNISRKIILVYNH